MSFDWNKHLRHTARHLARMYEIPGARDQALHRLGELDRDPTWAGLLELVPPAMARDRSRRQSKHEAGRPR